jgi:hypothetical protein
MIRPVQGELPMSRPVMIELLDDPEKLRLPKGVHDRLQHLLDKQDGGARLTEEERLEAEGIVEVAELLSLLKARAERARRNGDAA